MLKPTPFGRSWHTQRPTINAQGLCRVIIGKNWVSGYTEQSAADATSIGGESNHGRMSHKEPTLRNLLIALLTLWGSLISPLTLGQTLRIESIRPSSSQAQAQESPPDPRFGMVEAFWDTTTAVEGGVAWERILFQWSELQPNGPDDWNTLHVPDEWLQWAQAQGREVVGLLKNTPYWATDADPPMEASPPRGLDLPIDDPGNIWAAFVRRVATFYGPRGVHRWIIWNEPDIPPGVYGQEWAGSVEEYYRLLKVAYLAIKEVDPEAHVHLAGLTFWHDQGWLRRFLAVATADPEAPAHGYFFDVISLHIYFQTDTVDYIVNETRAALAAYGLNKPIWINETNASPDADPQWPVTRPRWRVDLREQASFILQAYALGLAAGAGRIAVYRLIDAGLPPGGEPFGLLRPDHSRRPAYTAYRLVTQHYAGTRSVQVHRQPLLTQVTLERGERTTRVFWARTEAAVSVTVPALTCPSGQCQGTSQATLIDQEGNAQILDGSNGGYALTLPGARCADETLGCIIGGPTYLLVEEAPASAIGVPEVDQATPTVAVSERETTPTVETNEGQTTPTVEADATPLATRTLRPTPPAVTPPPTLTPSPSPSPSASPKPPPTATATASPMASPSATPTMTASATKPPPPVPTWTFTPEPSPVPSMGASGVVGLFVLGGLIVALAVGLIGFALWKANR